MEYDEGERDLVMLQHKFVVEWADGSEVGVLHRFSYPLFLMNHLNSKR